MFMETFRVYRDYFAMNKVEASIQIITDDPDLTIEFVRAIKGVEFSKVHVSYSNWSGRNRACVTFVVQKGIQYIPRIIPPNTPNGKRWAYWKTIDRFSRK